MCDSVSKSDIDQFVQTGEHDIFFRNFDGENLFDRIKRGHLALATGLLDEVRLRARNRRKLNPIELPSDLQAFARERVSPMVRGLFPRKEAERVIAVLEGAVVFLTPVTIKEVLLKESLSTAWDLANLYLSSVGAKLLSDEAPMIAGLSAEAKCYVSMAYFTEADPFADFVVHEAAHVFHNVKRKTIGLPATRNKEWLLPIAYRKRETFAYACEAYSRILAMSDRPRDRLANFELLKQSFCPSDERVDAGEYHDILSEAITRRNGWRSILDRCSEK